MKIYQENDNYAIRFIEEDSFSFPQTHWHNKVEIGFVLEGSIIIGVNNEKRLLKKGEAVILGSGDIHYYDGRNHQAKMLILIFSPEFIDSGTRWPKDKYFLQSYITEGMMPQNELDTLLHLTYQLMKENYHSDEVDTLYTKSHLYYICGTLLRYLPTAQIEDSTNNRLYSRLKLQQDIFTYIEENFRNDITLKSVAAHFHLSEKYFSKIFNAISSENFKTHLNTLRLKHAEKLLMEGTYSMSDIAFSCGFNSVRTFNRTFIGIRGMSPSHFQNMLHTSNLYYTVPRSKS